MRILYFSRGWGVHDQRFVEVLSENGHAVGVATLASSAALIDDTAEPAEWLDWQTMSLEEESPTACLQAMPAFEALLRSWVPDAIQAGPIQTCGFMAALTDSAPLVAVSWGSDLLVDAERGPEWSWATSFTLRRSHRVLVDADSVRVRLRRYADIAEDRVVQFPWGTEPDRFSPPRALDDGQETKVVLSTRSWEPLYGVDVVIEAFAKARSMCPHLRLVLLGGGSMEDAVRSRIKAHGMEDAVETPGFLRHEDLPELYRSADVYISAAKSDGTSVSLLEAMGTGLPVVVTDNASNREWVEPGVTGWLAEPEDVEGFAAGILEAARLEGEDRLRAQRRSRKVVVERADWKENSSLLLDAYRELANSKPCRGR